MFSKDWGVSIEEAKETVDRWYKDRPEVRMWQQHTIRQARETKSTRTLMGILIRIGGKTVINYTSLF